MLQSTYLRVIILLPFSILRPLLNNILQHHYYLMHPINLYMYSKIINETHINNTHKMTLNLY